jgi:2-keto-3-deoxy-6-phosphogluconate aldolase
MEDVSKLLRQLPVVSSSDTVDVHVEDGKVISILQYKKENSAQSVSAAAAAAGVHFICVL